MKINFHRVQCAPTLGGGDSRVKKCDFVHSQIVKISYTTAMLNKLISEAEVSAVLKVVL